MRAAPAHAPPAGTAAGAPGAAPADAPAASPRQARASLEMPPGFLAARAPARGAVAEEGSAHSWVYRHVSRAIVEGLLQPGLRLPSARVLSQAWGVARGAVDEALMRLAREGLLERRVGRGSSIARRLPTGTVREVNGRAALARQAGETLDALAPLLRMAATRVAASGLPAAPPTRLRLDPRVPDTGLFPLAAWRRCLDAAHAEADRSSLCYGVPGGWAPLREATARHLALTRAIECSAEQVIILNGPLQAFDLVVRVLLEPGDPIVVERPGYMSIARHVGLPPLDLHGGPVDDEGLDVAAARRECPVPALIYVHPLNQYPTGGRLSPSRRADLLAWARESRAWVIEGDHLGEIVHDGPVPPSLMRAAASPRPSVALPRRLAGGSSVDGDDGQVLFLGTFNGVMFPGLRLSYLVVPRRLVAAFTAVRGLFGEHPPLAPQQALAAFIDRGHLAAHLRRMRGVYRERRDAMVDAARRFLLEEVRLGPLLGGTHGCLHLPPGCADEPLAKRLVETGFGIEMMSRYSWPRQGRPGIVLGYGADDLPGIEPAMRRLAALVKEAIDASPRAAARGSGGGPAAGTAAGRSVTSGRA